MTLHLFKNSISSSRRIYEKIPITQQGDSAGSNEIPVWIKNNAGWWADGSIDDSSFVQRNSISSSRRIYEKNTN